MRKLCGYCWYSNGHHAAWCKRPLVLFVFLLAACSQAPHEWHCPPCDVPVDGSTALACPDPTCIGDDAGAPAADAGSEPDAYEPPAIERSAVCALVTERSNALGCNVACPSSWAPLCTGPNPGWCLTDLQTQVATCADLTILVQAGGECDLACRS